MDESAPKYPHYLIITISEDDGSPDWQEEREWEIEHDPRCPTEEWTSDLYPDDPPVLHHTCLVGQEVSYNGIDSLEVDWETLEAGRYEIELWSNYDSFNMEYDGGLSFVETNASS